MTMTQTPREKIRQLRALLDEALITEQDFIERKNAILDTEFSPTDGLVTFAFPPLQNSGTDLGFVAGQEIGGRAKPYRLERLLGQGGMGQVWQATDLATQAELGHSELVALKILPPQLTQSAMHTRLLIEEASMVRKLAHENIVRVYEWAQDPATSSYFIIMEYLDGQDLDSHLAAHGPCSLQQALSMLRPVAQALQYAWEKHGLVHRDLKPGNLFLTRQGEIKVLDFGISARLRSNTSPLIQPSTRWPNAGTAGYRAPEAGTHQRVFNPALDVYAVAVMLYQMLEGAIPFGEWRNPAQYGQAPSAPLGLTAAQWQVLQSGFAIEPAQRPASVQALLDALQADAAGQSPDTRQARNKVQTQNPPQRARTALEQQSIEFEAAARFRAEQRRQRKELEQQRRRQASRALHALVDKQNKLREIEQQQRQERQQSEDAIRMRTAQNPHAPRLMPDRAAPAPAPVSAPAPRAKFKLTGTIFRQHRSEIT